MFSLHFLCVLLLCLRCLGGCNENSDCEPLTCYTVVCQQGDCHYDFCAYPTPYCGEDGCMAFYNDDTSENNPECSKDHHCSSTESPYCLSGHCVDCLRDSDCQFRHCYSVECFNGDCYYEPCTDPTPYCGDTGCMACKFDAHCEDNQFCHPSGLCINLVATTPVPNQCTQDNQCSDITKPYCLKGQCVACISKLDCTGSTPGCDTDTGTCIPCRANKDCDATLPVCTPTGECTKCTEQSDCLAATPVCHTVSGSCVECLKDEDCLPFDTCTPATCQADHICAGMEASSCVGSNEICVGGECVIQISVTIAGPKQGTLTFIPGNKFQAGFSIHAPSGTVLRVHSSRGSLQGTCTCEGTDTNCVPGGIGISCYSAYETIQLSFPEDDLWLPSADPEDDKSCFITCQVPPTLCSADPQKRAEGATFVVDTMAEPCIFGVDLQLTQGVTNTPVLIKAHYGTACGAPWGDTGTFLF